MRKRTSYTAPGQAYINVHVYSRRIRFTANTPAWLSAERALSNAEVSTMNPSAQQLLAAHSASPTGVTRILGEFLGYQAGVYDSAVAALHGGPGGGAQ